MGNILKKSDSHLNTYLTFKLGDEYFGIHVSNLLNIIEYEKISKIPKAPDYFIGIMNLRGKILPIIDTRTLFNMEYKNPDLNTCILVLDVEFANENKTFGITVDSVSAVIAIEEEAIKQIPSLNNRFVNHFISGLYHDKQKFIMLVGVDKLLTKEDLLEVRKISEQFD